MRDWVKFGLPAIFAAAVVFFFNLGGPRLWDRDEPRNAGCAWEMIQRGDWVTPYFNGQIRDHKPVLLYWFMMSAYAVFGVNEFAARFWSALLGVGSVALTFDLARRWVSPRAGFWAGHHVGLVHDVSRRGEGGHSRFRPHLLHHGRPLVLRRGGPPLEPPSRA